MEGRTWAMLGVFFFIVCFAGVVSYLFEIDSRQRELSIAQVDLKAAQGAIESKTTAVKTAKAGYESLRKLVEGTNSLSESTKALDSAISDLREQKAATLKAFLQSVAQARDASPGMPWTDIPLGNGQTLREVKIQKATETEVTLTHKEGVMKLSGDSLTKELRERFRIGMVPLTVPPPPPETPATAAETAAEKSETPDSPASVYAAPQTTMGSQKLSHLEIDIQAREEKIRSLEQNRSQWLTQARTFRGQATSAQSMGRPSYNHNAQATQAEENARATQVEIEKLRAEITQLRKRIVDAMTVR